jgi:hypothetical protein
MQTGKPDGPAGSPVFDRFGRFDSGSLAERFCALTGPGAGSVPSLTGPTGRSGPVLTTFVQS